MLHNAYDCSGLRSLDNQKAALQHHKVPKNPWCLNAFPNCGSAIPIIRGEGRKERVEILITIIGLCYNQLPNLSVNN